ncbi:MAG: flagellar assembly protein FliW [Spirochaetes bacterium]|nr:flagellar assembly protein FliW [Brevinematales bacterium]MCL1958567.1 flagellar assembly protein FliW [Spirochaetota bacterium]
MKVNTKAFGLIDVDEKQKINFPEGLFGFEDYNDYVLLDAEKEPFFWLQCVNEQDIAFILVNPFLFRPDYEVNIANEELAKIGITSPENALIFSIVTIPQGGNPMTANLQGPLVINKADMKGMQAVLSDPRWKTKHDIIAELSGTEK